MGNYSSSAMMGEDEPYDDDVDVLFHNGTRIRTMRQKFMSDTTPQGQEAWLDVKSKVLQVLREEERWDDVEFWRDAMNYLNVRFMFIFARMAGIGVTENDYFEVNLSVPNRKTAAFEREIQNSLRELVELLHDFALDFFDYTIAQVSSSPRTVESAYRMALKVLRAIMRHVKMLDYSKMRMDRKFYMPSEESSRDTRTDLRTDSEVRKSRPFNTDITGTTSREGFRTDEDYETYKKITNKDNARRYRRPAADTDMSY